MDRRLILRIKKKGQGFIALVIIFLAIFVYGLYFWESWNEISTENRNYKIEGEIIEKLLTLENGKCIPINYYLDISVFSYYGKGVINIGPFKYNIRSLKLYTISNLWPNEIVSYKKVNTTYFFSYLKDNNVYVQIVYPFPLEPTSRKGMINMICLEGRKVIIQ